MSNKKKELYHLKKLEIFYKEIEQNREKGENEEKMRIPTDLEFQQNEIYRLKKKYNIEMFSWNIRDGKAFATE